MSSIRVPADLLADLHAAAPAGTSLPALLRYLLNEAEGPFAVRARLERERHRAMACANVERLRAADHRSVRLAPDEQIALAEACKDWCRLLEARGDRVVDPVKRTIWLRSRPAKRRGTPIRIERTGLEAP